MKTADQRITTITIPVPLDRDLSPNARHAHWSSRRRAVEQARMATAMAVRTTKPRLVSITVISGLDREQVAS